MKNRSGFVSNSSSTSFIIGTNEEQREEYELNLETIKGIFDLPKGWLGDNIAIWIRDQTQMFNMERYLDDHSIRNPDEIYTEMKKFLEKYDTVAICEVSNHEGDSLSALLHGCEDKITEFQDEYQGLMKEDG